MKLHFHPRHEIGVRDFMIYGHFIEHFHRQIYGGVYDPASPFADEDGFRTDVLDAMRRIRVPVLRWPGGCYASAYHWRDGVGQTRTPRFDKAWRVEDPNTFGTDEYIRLCRKVGCMPYICTNAGTGTAEEMSDWMEYCNLENEGANARARIANGYPAPHRVKYWSIGNENYGSWEIGAKGADEWARLVLESAKMMRHVDPTAELSAAALSDLDWNTKLLGAASDFLDWISIHGYWDGLWQENDPASYEASMAYTASLDTNLNKVRGLLTAMGLEKRIRIAFDEWNLRGWHHPNSHTVIQGVTKDEYITPRDKNDDNSQYTMADAVFSACFLNMINRNCDIVGMANFAPLVNTRGAIYTHKDGIVLRSTYHVFDLYVNHLGDRVLHSWNEEEDTVRFAKKHGGEAVLPALDVLVTAFTDKPGLAIAAVNRDAEKPHTLILPERFSKAVLRTVNGPGKDAYNDTDRNEVTIRTQALPADDSIDIEPHSVNVIELL